MTESQRTESELLFEEYLIAHACAEWEHEKPLPGKRKHPDYYVQHRGRVLIFEVKEFEAQPPQHNELGFYNAYDPLREKINQAVRQLREYKEFACSIVLANPKSVPLIHLGDWWAIYGAMFGNLGFAVPVGPDAEKTGPIKNVFLRGGKMVDEKRRKPQNTTVSSIIVLGTYPLWAKQVQLAIKERQTELGRKTTLEEDRVFYEAMPESPDLRRVRASVYENPYARIPLSRDLFNGPFDQRWGVEGQSIKRLYVGPEVARFEATLGER
jgi:hypothetical protein